MITIIIFTKKCWAFGWIILLLFYVASVRSLFLCRQKFDTFLMLQIGSYVIFRIAAPPTTRLPVDLSISGLKNAFLEQWKLQEA